MHSSWLIRDGMDRARMIDMERHLVPARRRAFGVLMLALIASAPWLGWLGIVPLVVAAIVFRLAVGPVSSAKRPEFAMFAIWLATESLLALSVLLSGGPRSHMSSWLAIPVIALAARFPPKGIAAGVAFALALLAGIAFGVDPHAVLANPTLILAPAALILAVTVFSVALMRSDLHQRSQALVDPLTGMLNRSALSTRSEELAQQSGVTGAPVGMIVADIDRFKQINDIWGHAAGDAVLRLVGHVMREELRAFDLVYRLGGEEFLVLLPGADARGAAALAEQLRGAIAQRAWAGIPMSISCGVAASHAGERFDYDALFSGCDAALYRAKDEGRNRVCTHEAQLAPPEGEAPIEVRERTRAARYSTSSSTAA